MATTTISHNHTTPIHHTFITTTSNNNSLRYSSSSLKFNNKITFWQNLKTPNFLRVSVSSSLSTMSIAGAPVKTSLSSVFLYRGESSSLQFVKYHGLGDHFILVDNRDTLEPEITPEQAVMLCDRHGEDLPW